MQIICLLWTLYETHDLLESRAVCYKAMCGTWELAFSLSHWLFISVCKHLAEHSRGNKPLAGMRTCQPVIRKARAVCVCVCAWECTTCQRRRSAINACSRPFFNLTTVVLHCLFLISSLPRHRQARLILFPIIAQVSFSFRLVVAGPQITALYTSQPYLMTHPTKIKMALFKNTVPFHQRA